MEIAATINQRPDFETAQIIVEEWGWILQLKRRAVSAENSSSANCPNQAIPRPPIVAVMGMKRMVKQFY